MAIKAKVPSLPLLAIAALEIVHLATAALQHRIPSGHDGFQYFTQQYFFLNNAINSGDIPQWIPYMTQGTVASLWYGIQASLLQNLLLHLPWLARGADLLSVYHAGMFIDQMILLTGTWLLARRFFSLPASYFVAVSVVGSSVWIEQPYWNFRLLYAIPLVLELGHRFLDTGRWRWCFLSANLLALQVVGNLPYMIPVVSFVVAAYFGAFLAINFREAQAPYRRLRWSWHAALTIAATIAGLAIAYSCFMTGTESLVSYNPGRNPDGSTTLAVFLTYGGGIRLSQWLDLVLSLSPWLDMTLYAGRLLLPLLLVGVICVDRARAHFVVAALLVLLFTLGTPLATALYYLWPGMKYFRHIGLVSPIVKLLFCFVGGIGFEWLWEIRTRPIVRRRVGAIAALGLTAFAAGSYIVTYDHASMIGLANAIVSPGFDRPISAYMPDVLAHRLRLGGLLSLAGAAAMAVVSFGVHRTQGSSERTRRALLATLLVLVTADVYRFKFDYLVEHTYALPSALQMLTRLIVPPYRNRREVDLKAAALQGTDDRLEAALDGLPPLRARLLGRASRGAQYWTNDAFLFLDEAGSTFQVDSWLRPLDQLLRTYWQVPLDPTQRLPRDVDLAQLSFPLSHPSAGRIAGVTEDKIRFFSSAYQTDTSATLQPLLNDQTFNGNLLFVIAEGSATPPAQVAPARWTAQRPLASDDSVRLPYSVRRFDANTLDLVIHNNGATARWMSYADVWHPSWRATVNGRRVPVYRAQMAYKAVPLEPGENVVSFRFDSARFSVLSLALFIQTLMWLFVGLYCGARSLVTSET